MKVLVTGGAGFIGSNTAVELIAQGHEVVVVDNFSNSSPEAVRRMEQIAGRPIVFYRADVRDEAALGRIFCEHAIDLVIHFAGYKAVGESVQQPLKYYDNNINSTISLCAAMLRHGVKKLVFSSSATVYGADQPVPLHEGCRVGGCSNPYGYTKFICEQIIGDVARANPGFSVALLRYFNPVGAHESGIIGENPSGIPNNLMPYISQVAVGRREKLSVFGNDYDTQDGTGVRDYIHITDLAKGHTAAMDYLREHAGCFVFNLGTGRGYSVLEVIAAFERASGMKIPYEFAPRREGDLPKCYADTSKSQKELDWCAKLDLDAMCRDAWRFQKMNPNGY